MNITEAELKALENAGTAVEWDTVCDAVKTARRGAYPPDWHMKVLRSGLAGRTMAKWGDSDQIRVIPLE